MAEVNVKLTGDDGEYMCHIDGCPEKGIPDFDGDIEGCKELMKSLMTVKFNRVTYDWDITYKGDIFTFYKGLGLYDWVCTYCPNRRVVHLIKNGKNFRVKTKNFSRAMRILVCYLCLVKGE